PTLEGLEAALGDADAARVAVVDEDRRRAGLEVDIGREAADVPAVAHRPEREQRDHRVLGRVERAEQPSLRVEVFGHPGLWYEPDRLGLELGLRKVELDDVERGLVVDRLLLVRDHLLADDDRAERELQAEPLLGALRLVDRGHQLFLRLRVVVAGERLDERGAGLEIERDDPELLTEMQIDRALVDGRVGALVLDQAEDRAGRAVDDREGVHPGRAERHSGGRVVAPGPDVAGVGLLQLRQLGGAVAPRIALSESSSGASKAAERTWPSRTRWFSWSRIAASTRRPSRA